MNKKLLLFIGLSCIGLSLQAQSFTDDFESYNAGAKLGPQSPKWTTWSNADGGTEDVNVITTDAHSGTKSIYFSSTSATGGPVDVVLPFGGAYNTGSFDFRAWFKVPATKSGYFNFQGNTTIGQVWAVECYMNADGSLTMGNTAGQLLATTFPVGQWFELHVAINFNSNRWEVFIDSVSKGFFSNTNNQVASLNIYPPNASASYWVDDVSYVVTPFVLPTLNAALQQVSVSNGLTGQSRIPSLKIRNLGLNAITAMDINVNYKGVVSTQTLTGLNIGSLVTSTIKLSNPVVLQSGTDTVFVTISNINGLGNDADLTDNASVAVVNAVQPAVGKVVVAEEATGTWCQWCPRGAVFMDYMEDSYHGYYAGIAVHNADPMVYTAYDAAISAQVPGYPSALVDRITPIDPSDLESNFITSVVNAPVVTLKNGATYDPATRRLKVSVSNTTVSAMTGNYSVACVLTEDSIKGTGAGYNQANAYAGGGNGVMGGYEILPNPVPAARMVYDHVARIIVPSFGGYQNAFGASTDSGITTTYTYTFDLPTAWKVEKLNIIGMVIRPDGTIENGSTSRVAEAEANGYVMGTEIGGNAVGFTSFTGPDALQFYPNPATDFGNISLTLAIPSSVHVTIYSLDGKEVSTRDYGMLEGGQLLPVNTSLLSSGLYLVKVNAGNDSQTIKISVR
jgi:hypothetical protein